MLQINATWLDIKKAVPSGDFNILVLTEDKEIQLSFYYDEQFYLSHSTIVNNDEDLIHEIEKKYGLPYPEIKNVTHWLDLKDIMP